MEQAFTEFLHRGMSGRESELDRCKHWFFSAVGPQNKNNLIKARQKPARLV